MRSLFVVIALVGCSSPSKDSPEPDVPDAGMDPVDGFIGHAEVALDCASGVALPTRSLEWKQEWVVTATNAGDGAAVMAPGAFASGAQLAYKGGAFPGMGGTCGSQLAAGASCTIVVEEQSSQLGDLSELLTLAFTTAGRADAPVQRSCEFTGSVVKPAALAARLFAAAYQLPRAAVVLANGTIVFAGFEEFVMNGTDARRFLIKSRAIDGSEPIPFPTLAQSGEIFAIAANGNALSVVGASADGQLVIGRLLTTGAVDATFGTQGFKTITHPYQYLDLSGRRIVKIGDRFLVGGRTATNEVVVMRFDANGTMDAGFPRTYSQLSSISGMTVSGTKLYAIVRVNGGDAVARFLANGDVDTSFGTNGYLVTTLPSPFPGQPLYTDPQQVVEQADGKVIVCGTLGGGIYPTDAVLARYTATGAYDPTWNSTRHDYGSNDSCSGLMMTPTQKVLAIVSGGINRFYSTGFLDAAYGTNGRTGVQDFGQSSIGIFDIMEHPSGLLLVFAGYVGQLHSTGSASADVLLFP